MLFNPCNPCCRKSGSSGSSGSSGGSGIIVGSGRSGSSGGSSGISGSSGFSGSGSSGSSGSSGTEICIPLEKVLYKQLTIIDTSPCIIGADFPNPCTQDRCFIATNTPNGVAGKIFILEPCAAIVIYYSCITRQYTVQWDGATDYLATILNFIESPFYLEFEIETESELIIAGNENPCFYCCTDYQDPPVRCSYVWKFAITD